MKGNKHNHKCYKNNSHYSYSYICKTWWCYIWSTRQYNNDQNFNTCKYQQWKHTCLSSKLPRYISKQFSHYIYSRGSCIPLCNSIPTNKLQIIPKWRRWISWRLGHLWSNGSFEVFNGTTYAFTIEGCSQIDFNCYSSDFTLAFTLVCLVPSSVCSNT